MDKEKIEQGEKVLFSIGYKKEVIGNSTFYYMYNGSRDKFGFKFFANYKEVYPVYCSNNDIAIPVTMKELKAISLICNGLGWD